METLLRNASVQLVKFIATTKTSSDVGERIKASHIIQLERFRNTELKCNADMSAREVKDFCKLESAAQGLLRTAMKQLHLTARAFHHVLKLSLTIADLERAEIIKTHHVAEALQYRHKELI